MKRVVLITASAFVLGLVFLMMQRVRNPICEAPLILFGRSQDNQPEAIAASRLITELGGLPKTDMNIYEAFHANDVSPIYPVEAWRVEKPSVTNALFNAFFDDDPTYSHEFTLQVKYVDGETAVLQWSSWSYGMVACPILFSMGSGPPGQLEIEP